MLTVTARSAVGFAVEIAGLRAAAAAFARLLDDAVDLLRAAGFAGTGGMAGADPVLAAWRARYDAVAAAEWAVCGVAAATLVAVGDKLAVTADTYLAADHTGGSSGLGARADRAPPGRGAPAAPWVGPGPPGSTGSAGPPVPDALAAYFPGGDPALLRAAAAAWRTLADGVDRVATAGDAAFRELLTTGEGATFSAMRAFWARQYVLCATEPLFNAVADGARTLSASCTALADLVDRTRSAVLGAAAEAAHDMTPLELPAGLLSEVAWGVPELELLLGTGALAVAYLDGHRDAYLFEVDRLVERLGAGVEQRLRRVAAPPPAPTGVGLGDVGEVAGLELTGTRWDASPSPHPTPDSIHITPDAVTHVLTGDRKGGGHAPGVGRPGKNEFPRGWAEQQIIAAGLDVARDPDHVTRAQTKNRWIVTGRRNGVLIRVVVDHDGSITTVIPWSGPGVVTNPD